MIEEPEARAREEDFEFLRKHYGSHMSVARKLKIAPDYYRRVRNQSGKFGGSGQLHGYILTLVKQIKGIQHD